jgi:hypothetical protein
MKMAGILALAFALTTGMALTAAFGLGLLPLGFWQMPTPRYFPAKNLQIVIPVTDGLGRFWQS